MQEINFQVAFMPKNISINQPQVCVLVDVLRATTAMVTMLEKGCTEIVLTTDEQKTMAEKQDEYNEETTLVCSEDSDGNVSQHAHFSPSLAAIQQIAVKGKRVVLKTTNGTLAGLTLWKAGISHILIGCLHNAKAVMDKAVKMARELKSNITIVCSGRENGQIAALDDVYTAGVLLKYGQEATKRIHCRSVLNDSAKISHHLLNIYSHSKQALEDSGSGETMRRINCLEDILICAQENISTIAPEVRFTEEHGLVVKNMKEVVYK